jgi:plasmid stabilization system protein ParE
VSFRVVVLATAQAEAEEAFRYVFARSPADAVRWFDELHAAIAALGTFPNSYPLARERARSSGRRVRQLVHGRGVDAYRILFVVVGDEVHVLHVRRAARRGLRRI